MKKPVNKQRVDDCELVIQDTVGDVHLLIRGRYTNGEPREKNNISILLNNPTTNSLHMTFDELKALKYIIQEYIEYYANEMNKG